MNKLTVHSIIKNEPFIYYSIKSVYKYADVIFLYDTGSTDQYVLGDILKLISEDYDHKIIFKQILISNEETNWDVSNAKRFSESNKGEFGVASIRQQQIDNTDTEFFMILDGDEIHYSQTMKLIRAAINNWNSETVAMLVPLVWLSDFNNYFLTTNSCRIFATNKVVMNKTSYPCEMHLQKGSRKSINAKNGNMSILKGATPYIHLEKIVKPWRRKVNKASIKLFTDSFPLVMQDTTYIERFLSESKS